MTHSPVCTEPDYSSGATRQRSLRKSKYLRHRPDSFTGLHLEGYWLYKSAETKLHQFEILQVLRGSISLRSPTWREGLPLKPAYFINNSKTGPSLLRSRPSTSSPVGRMPRTPCATCSSIPVRHQGSVHHIIADLYRASRRIIEIFSSVLQKIVLRELASWKIIPRKTAICIDKTRPEWFIQLQKQAIHRSSSTSIHFQGSIKESVSTSAS